MTARAYLPKHPRQGWFFRVLQRAGITSESLAAYVADCTGVSFAAATVRQWARGERPIDAEVVFLALEHAGDDAHLVLDALAAEHGCVCVRLPEAVAGASPTATRRALLISALGGEVARLTAEATDPDGPGGAGWTDAERDAVKDVERQLARLLATEPAARAAGLRVTG